MAKAYNHLFFDLDHTLWDYDRNVAESLAELFQIYNLQELGVPGFDALFHAFEKVNYELWDRYNIGTITKEALRATRFRSIFERVGANPARVPLELEADFLTRTSSKPHVFPDTFEVLDYLAGKYPLHIITNGFDESQGLKLKSSGLHSYFQLVVTSETTGHRKPDRRIFDHALISLGARPEECVMIGDNPRSDIMGALNAGIDQVFFNPKEAVCSVEPTFTVQTLAELRNIF
ncbi:MAG: YjjG family noncanonical pyrimidine nucleotidase [Lunatimonas sp.]|uniref:YjjG family noncanonical pyrimidine nucleotidase n=1 Tax=Lunatimonas sp. TaxID=2060141 RepID=UPI00263B976A|nr:YjjG family noncanonical pyrimidine nucleotidase [Lunatimonas sp.]MCC5939654.1 YjjG family noncanonical pyrimidine nucleotidase [Lunatimonas sp.]